MPDGTELRRRLQEIALYPPHPPRKPTALYLQSHERLVVDLDLPCLVCGVRNSDLQDPARAADPKVNKWGSKQIETHHRVIEDSLANAVDVEKFNRKVLPGLLKRFGDQAKYGHPFTQGEMIEWIHGDEGNLWVLCDVHHRHPLVGIHAITYPVWSVQDILLDDYDLTGFQPYPPEGAQLAAITGRSGEEEHK